MKRILWTLSSVLAALGIAAAVLITLNLRGEEPLPAAETLQSTPVLVQRGEYLARVGNCMACHTTQGGAPFAGGRGIETPFGVVHSSNLTPDRVQGIGSWTSAEFWRAMHHGRSKDGRLLYPAFPYPNYAQVTREDSDAIFAYLQSVPAAPDANRAHALRFPYNTQAALAVWRALFFAPGAPSAEPTQTAEYNRGAYLVNGLGHCTACHTPRNALGATSDAKAFTGGLIPVQNWYAPALNAAHEAGVKEWRTDDVVALLKTGVAPQGSVLGPMAEVVFRSTQYLSDADARAMAVYLQGLPQQDRKAPATVAAPRPARWRGAARCTSSSARSATATGGRASRARFRHWRATAPSRWTTPPTWCAWCCRAATCPPPQATRVRTACRRFSRPCRTRRWRR